jgi:hypothetical protein
MKQFLAGAIFVVMVLIAFSEATPNVSVQPPLVRAIHDLLASARLR